MKILLKSFQLNGHTIGFYTQTQKLEIKIFLKSFQLNGHTLGFYTRTQKLEAPCTA